MSFDGVNQQAARIRELEDETRKQTGLALQWKELAGRKDERIRELEAEAQAMHDRKEELAGLLKMTMHRIAELEGWLVEERAEKIVDSHRGTGDWTRMVGSFSENMARQQLISEGKIGSGEHIVDFNNMMLTKEQREALDFVVRWLDDDPCEFLLSPIGKGYRDILCSLLYSKNPACWEATEERKAALSDALYWIPTPKCGASAEVLRRMLEEARP